MGEPEKSSLIPRNQCSHCPPTSVSSGTSQKSSKPLTFHPPTIPDDDSSPSSRIPQEILIQVFKYLTNTHDLLHCIRVSKNWCGCAIALLWKKPRFLIYDTMVKVGRVLAAPQQTFTYARLIRHLDLSDLDLVESEVLLQFRHCDSIEYLNLQDCESVPEELLIRTFAHLENLTTINLNTCCQITDDLLIHLARTITRLEDIQLRCCDTITDRGILALARSCPGLRDIGLVSISLLTDLTFTSLAKSCPLLTKIEFSSCSVTDLGVRSLWQQSTQMQELVIFACMLLTNNAFPALPPRSSGQLGASGDVLPPLILNRSFDQMRLLNLTGSSITDDAVEGIIFHAPNIEDLNLTLCPQLTGRALEAICKLGKSLQYLRFGYSNEITDSAIRLLARSCPTLETLKIGNCDQTTLATMNFLLQKLGNLTCLKLFKFPPFQDRELQRAYGEIFGPDPEDRKNAERRMEWADFWDSEIPQLRDFLRELQEGTAD